jgi:hypothetical protein
LQIRFACALGAALAAAWLVAAPADASGYSYAGLVGTKGALGVAGTVTAIQAPSVQQGHVAAWVGVGGPHDAPDGTAEWLQVGLNSGRGSANHLYYEYVRPGILVTYVEIAAAVPIGHPVRLAVLKCAVGHDLWRVWVNGWAVSDPISLPASNGRLTPVATAESYDGGTPGVVNAFSYSFGGVRVASAAGGVWRAFAAGQLRQDDGVLLIPGMTGSFVATSVSAARVASG